MLQLKIYFTIRLLIHFLQSFLPSTRIFHKPLSALIRVNVFSWNTFKIYPYRKQKFDDSGEQKVGRGRNKRLSGRETSGSLSTGSDNSANLETWSNTRPCNVRPASVNNVARPDLPPPRARKDGACTRTRASINIWAGSPERWTVARAIGTAGYIIHAR